MKVLLCWPLLIDQMSCCWTCRCQRWTVAVWHSSYAERARPRTPHRSGLGKIRWVVKSTLSWIGLARCAKIRSERLPAMPHAFPSLHLAGIGCWILERHF